MLVASRTRVTPDLADDLRGAGLALVDGEQVDARRRPERDATPGRVWLLTSGSTGRPKQVAHTLASLTTVAGDQPRRTWLCPYAHGAYAWWQVVTLSMAHPGQDVLFIEPDELDTLAGPGPRGRGDRGVRARRRSGARRSTATPRAWRRCPSSR